MMTVVRIRDAGGLVLLALGFAGSVLAADQPDLVPVSEVVKDGRFGVENEGTAEAGPSVLTITCVNNGGGDCPQAEGMKDYLDADFPDKLVVKIPALPPGRLYMHSLRFWPELQWALGSYSIALFADASDSVKESEETNNIAVVNRQVPTSDALPTPTDRAPLSLVHEPAAPKP